MKKRIITGAVILLITALFIVSRLYTPYTLDLFIGLMAVMACVEVSRVLERKRMFTSIIFVGSFPAIIYLAIYLGILNNRQWLFYLMYFIIIVIIVFVLNYLYTTLFKNNTAKEKDKYGVFVSNRQYAVQKGMNSLFVLLYPAMLFGSMFFINHYFELEFAKNPIVTNGSLLTLFFVVLLFAVTMFTDTFALVVGLTIKGPKLCPRISPKKTISGAIGGLVFGTLGGLLIYYLFRQDPSFLTDSNALDLAWYKILIVSFISSIFVQIGDLVASALKRSARVKDYGTIFPGHGGIMDRVDGLLFSSIVVLISMFILI